MKKLLLIIIALMIALPTFAQSYTKRMSQMKSFSDWGDILETRDYVFSDESGVNVACIKEVDTQTSNETIDSVFYDNRGNITKISTWMKNEGGWDFVSYVEYAYDNKNQKVSRENYSDFGFGFELNSTYMYNYDEEGKMIYWVLNAFDMEYQNAVLEYNDAGLIETEMIQLYNFETSKLEYSYLTEYEYDDDNNLIRCDYSEYSSDAWSLRETEIYEFDENGDCVLYEKMNPDSTVVLKKVYVYDTSISSEEIFYYPDPENDFPIIPKSKHMLLSIDCNELGKTYVLTYEDGSFVGAPPVFAYDVLATINLENAGIITGAGTYNHGDEVTLTATPNEGYKFLNWTENDTIVSEESKYSFTIAGDRNLVANFVSTESIEELATSFRIYPNPANDKLFIVTEIEVNEVVVYDVYGRQQVNKTTKQQGGVVINVADLSSGVYFVMIKTDEGVVTKRFMKR